MAVYVDTGDVRALYWVQAGAALADMLDLEPLDYHLFPRAISGESRNIQLHCERPAGAFKAAPELPPLSVEANGGIRGLYVVSTDNLVERLFNKLVNGFVSQTATTRSRNSR